ncbi:MAG TPA: hypothetical protein VNI02_10195 [Blastocatellia bacterium]|jgi:hypothetical protein|nr:hypothetical protein [Blastocatellia bacterium]
MTIKNLTSDKDAEPVGEKLSAEQIKAKAKLERMIKENGATPLTAEQLRAMGDLWPEDETVDEFLAWREEMRGIEATKGLP